jgi:hypothetical protein
MQTVGIKCSVCGYFHPSPECQKINKDDQEIDLTFLFSNLKNICYSKIKNNEIKNQKKLFSHIIIEITKILDNYKED